MKYKSNFEHQCLLLVLLETLVMFQYKPEYKLVYLLPANTTSISNFIWIQFILEKLAILAPWFYPWSLKNRGHYLKRCKVI